MSGIFLSGFDVFNHLTLMIILGGKSCYYSHCADEELEAQSSSGPCPKLHSQLVVQLEILPTAVWLKHSLASSLGYLDMRGASQSNTHLKMGISE